jgi:putative tricarboxylic transport membrane protein
MVMDDLTPPALDDQDDEIPTGWARWSELGIAAALIVIGIIILIQTQDIRVVRAMSQVSPRAIPKIVGSGLIIIGIWYAIDIIRNPNMLSAGEDDEDVDINAPTDWKVLAVIAVALVVFAILIEPAGFIIASAALFTISSTAMGSRKIGMNAVIGIVLATIIYVGFDIWLGVRLPGGITESIFN